jgi:imidazolonepropionase-like amidohydrolase
MRTMLCTLTLALAAGLSAPAEDLLFRDATLLTITRGTIPRGDLLVRNGKIAQLGPDLKVPAGVRVIDAKGMFLMPGIIDSHSHLAIEGGVNEATLSVTSMTNIKDVLDPDDVNIYRELAGGVTTTNTMHGSANTIGGQDIVIKLKYGRSAQELIFQGAMPGLKFALGENPKRSGGQGRYPATRLGIMDVIRQSFLEAKAYKATWDEYRRRSVKEKNLVPPAKDLALEPMLEVLEGKRLAQVHAYRADEILQMLRVAEEIGFKVSSFEHGLEAYKVAPEIARHGAAVGTFSDWYGYKLEAIDAIPYNAAICIRAGILTTINSDSAEEARHLNQEAAKCMRYGGITEAEALATITINPAKQFHIENRVGSLEVGKDADLVLFDRHPLSVYAVPQQVFIEGTCYFDRAADLARRPELEKEKKALLAKQPRVPEGTGRPASGRRGGEATVNSGTERK